MTAKNTHVTTLAGYAAAAAAATPFKRAIVFPQGRDKNGRVSYTYLTFKQLEHDINAFAAGLAKIGITKGMRVSLMVTPGLEFLPLTFALFKLGAVPVLIDPGMGKQNLLNCIRSAEPEAFLGIPRAQIAKVLFSKYFKSIKINVTIGRKLFWGGYTMDDIYIPGTPPPTVTQDPDELAAVLFTTGSTGPPKGVEYTHGMFCAQRDLLQEAFNLTADDVDMPAFALFSIFTLAMGCTVVIPDMDQTRPAQVDPTKIIEAIDNHGVTFCFGSPALWDTVSKYCVENGVTFPSLKKVFMAGAPIRHYLHERMLSKVLTEGGEVFTPYGATECLPVTSYEGSKVLAETAEETAKGRGFCVGQVLPGLEIKLIAITDEPIQKLSDANEVKSGEIGEIIVKGPVVSRRYFNMPDKTAEHKIYESDDVSGAFWHRIGDLGRFDDQNRLWMCGRKTHRVDCGDTRLFTVCCEAIFNNHNDVFRSALVGIGDDPKTVTPVMCVEPEQGKYPEGSAEEERFRKELLTLAQDNELTGLIKTVLFNPSFPVDIRHNAKIFREKLSVWAAEELKKQ